MEDFEGRLVLPSPDTQGVESERRWRTTCALGLGQETPVQHLWGANFKHTWARTNISVRKGTARWSLCLCGSLIARAGEERREARLGQVVTGVSNREVCPLGEGGSAGPGWQTEGGGWGAER